MAVTTIDVAFYAPLEAAVLVEACGDEDTGHAAALVAFALWGGQLLADLGKDMWADALIKDLDEVTLASADELNRYALGDVAWRGEHWAKWTDESPSTITAVMPRGVKAERRFVGRLHHGASVDSVFDLERQRDWKLKLKGMMLSGQLGRVQFSASLPLIFHAMVKSQCGDLQQTLKTRRAMRSGKSGCQLTMTGSTSVTATFSAKLKPKCRKAQKSTKKHPCVRK